jgi:hypothetical protein
LRNGGDGGQAFAAKSERRDRLQLDRSAKLAGRMSPQRQRKLIRFHSRAVIDDFDRLDAAALDVDGDSRRAGIHGILDEFFYDRGRTFDDLAGGDLTDRYRIEFADRCHALQFAGISRTSRQPLTRWG